MLKNILIVTPERAACVIIVTVAGCVIERKLGNNLKLICICVPFKVRPLCGHGQNKYAYEINIFINDFSLFCLFEVIMGESFGGQEETLCE